MRSLSPSCNVPPRSSDRARLAPRALMGGHDCGSALPRKWVQGAVAGTHQGISHCWCCYPRCGLRKCYFCPLLNATSVPSCFRRVLRVLDPVRVLRANKASTMHLKAVRAKAAESLRCISRRISIRDATRQLSARGFSSGHRFASSVWLRAEGGGAQAPTAQGLQTDRYTGIVKL